MPSLRIAVAFAAVLVAAVVGINFLPGQSVGTGPAATPSLAPSPKPSPSLTPNPDPTALPAFGLLAPGTYVIDDPFPLRVSMDVGDGWRIWSGVTSDGAAIYKDSPDPPNGKGVIVTIVSNVFANPCNAAVGMLDPALGPTVDDLAKALASQPRTEASPITAVSLDGYSGSYLEYTMADVPEPGCGVGVLNRWPTVAGNRQALLGEHDNVWILDVNGRRLVIDAFSFPAVTAADHAEIQEIVNSIQIE